MKNNNHFPTNKSGDFMQKQDPSTFPTKSTGFFGKLSTNSSTKETDIESNRSGSMKGVNIDMSEQATSTKSGGVMSFFQKKQVE